jgi:hypothetical protein
LRRSILVVSLAVSLVVILVAGARAHVAPSADVNNRYIKIALLRDSVRVAVTVFFGERPGFAERRRMDADGDGAIDAAEARAFGERVLRDVGAAIAFDLDGRRIDAWTLEDVGMGVATAAAGAFSVDLVVRAPLGDGDEHALRLEDRLQLPAPGEEQIRIEESPGVRLVDAYREPDSRGLQTTFDFTGNPGPSRTIRARFHVDGAVRPPPVRPIWPWAVAAGAVALAAVAVALRRSSPRARQ